MASFMMADQVLVVAPSIVPSMDIKDYVYATPTAQQQSAAVLQLAQAMFTAFSCQHPFSAWGLNGGTFSMNATQLPVATLQAQSAIQASKTLKPIVAEATDAAPLGSRKPRSTPAASSAKAVASSIKSPTSSSSGASNDTKEQPAAPTRRGRSGSVLRQQQEQPVASGSTPHELLSPDFELNPDSVRQMLEQGDSFQQDVECASSMSKSSAAGMITRRSSEQPAISLRFFNGGDGQRRLVDLPTAPRTYTHKRKLNTILSDSPMDTDELQTQDVLLCGQSSAPLPYTLPHPGCVGAAVSARLSWSPPSTSEDDSAHYSKETQLASLTADDLLLLAMLQPSSHASGEYGTHTYDLCGRDEVERKTAAMCIDAIDRDHDIGGKAILFPSGFESRSRADSMGSGSMDSCLSGTVDFLSADAASFTLAAQRSGSLSYSGAQDCFSMEEEHYFLPISTVAAGLQLTSGGAAPCVSSCTQQQPKAVSSLTAAMQPSRQFHSTSGGMKGLASFNALDALTDMMQDEDSTSNSTSSWGMEFDGLMEFDASDLFADL